MKEYFEHPALSRTDIVELLKGPNYFRAYKDNPKKSPALDLGTAFHMMLLEPVRFNEEYAVIPQGMKLNRKDGIEWKAQNEHKEILKYEDYEMIVSMTCSVKTHEFCSGLFERAIIENAFYFKHTETGHDLKAKPDLFSNNIIVDFKSARTLNERKLSYETIDRGYDIQAWMCREAVLQSTGELCEFYDVFVEKVPPYDVLITSFDYEDFARAERKVSEAVLVYRECIKRGLWPSVRPKTPQRLPLSTVIEEPYEEYENDL